MVVRPLQRPTACIRCDDALQSLWPHEQSLGDGASSSVTTLFSPHPMESNDPL